MNSKKLTILSSLLLLSSSLTLGCDNDPAKGKTKVEASAPVEQKTQEQSPEAQVLELAVTPDNSSVDFVGAKVTEKHAGSFKKFEGKIRLIDGDIEKSEVSVTVDMSSLAIEPAKLQGHLLSPDFFDVEKFPQASFSSTKIVAKAGDKSTHEVTGNLELRGTKKSVTFPATIKASENGAEVDTEFAINRKDFGIVYPGMTDDLIKDEVLIQLKLKPSK